MTLAEDVNIEDYIMSKDDLSGADIKAICTEAGLMALRWVCLWIGVTTSGLTKSRLDYTLRTWRVSFCSHQQGASDESHWWRFQKVKGQRSLPEARGNTWRPLSVDSYGPEPFFTLTYSIKTSSNCRRRDLDQLRNDRLSSIQLWLIQSCNSPKDGAYLFRTSTSRTCIALYVDLKSAKLPETCDWEERIRSESDHLSKSVFDDLIAIASVHSRSDGWRSSCALKKRLKVT